MNVEQQDTGVFINGKAQVIEMLQYMSPEDRSTLLKNIRLRNPALADELAVKGVTFDSLAQLSNHELRLIFPHVDAPIFGLALKHVSPEFQRRLLSMAPREYAEVAYKYMIAARKNEERDVKRAQAKVVNVLTNLSKKRQLNLTH